MPFLESRGLVVDRPGAPVLRFADLRLGKGDRILLLGPSGSGKTTLLSVLAGLLPPTSGTVLLDGRDLYTMASKDRDRLRGQCFGFVFQILHLLPSLTLRQNIALAGDLTGHADQARIDRLLESLDLAGKAHRKPGALSQGEQQRAAIARAVLNRPAIIIADEPTSALDDANAQGVVDLLLSQAEETGAALLIATHDRRITTRFSTIIDLHPQNKVAA